MNIDVKDIAHIVEANMDLATATSGDMKNFYKHAREFLEMSKKFEMKPHKKYLDMLLKAMPTKFGRVEEDTPMFAILESMAKALEAHSDEWKDHFNGFNATMQEYRNPLAELEKKIDATINGHIYKIDREIQSSMRKMVKEELETILKLKSAAETAEFLNELESI